MFYKEEDILKELICPKCSKTFEDPRILPCGYSLCQSCILNETDNESNSIAKCHCCQEKHSIPKEGQFIKNRFILKQLEKKPIEVKRGELGELLKKSMNTLIEERKELETFMKSGDQIVSDYLSEIRSQINHITETQIEKLNKARESLLDKLKQYQTECLYSKHANQTELFTKLDDHNKKIKRYLNGADWNEKSVNDQIREAKNLVESCSKAKSSFEKEIFLNKKPVFTPFSATLNDNEIVGKLTFDYFDKTNEKKSLIKSNDHLLKEVAKN